jgi:hypothetical protein
MATDVKPDAHTIESLDWEVPCKPFRHECTRAAEWAYERTHSCGCHWEIFYCSPCRGIEMANMTGSVGPGYCKQCRGLVTTMTVNWWPLDG